MADSLRFDELRVTRMPGFRHTGFHLGELSPGINVIHGPNGSGKTTSARAIEALLWPRTAGELRPTLSGTFELGPDRWSVEVDHDRAVHQRNGINTDPPVIPAAEERDRYRLSLHELISAESNARFARAILREAAGGYDLDAAADRALPSASAASTRSAEFRALRDAISERDDAVSHQRELHEQERGLSTLLRREEEASAAKDRAELLTAAIAHATAREAECRAREALAAFHPALEGMYGDEAERLRVIEEDLTTILGEIADAERKLAGANAAILDSALADSSVDAAFLTGLRADLESLRQRERTLEDCERERERAAERLDEARKPIAGGADDQRPADIDIEALGDLTGFADRAGRARLRVEGTTARIATLDREGGAAGDIERELDRIGVAERCLRQWLRTSVPRESDQRHARAAALSAGALLLVLGLALASSNALALLLSGFGAAVIAVVLLRRDRATDERERLQGEYAASEIDLPDEWSAEAVLRRLNELGDRRSAASLARERSAQRAHHLAELAAAEQDLAALEGEGRELAERLGVSTEIDPTQLVWLAYRIGEWQTARGVAAGASAAASTAREQVEEAREALRARLQPFSGEQLETSGDFATAIHRLGDRRECRDGGLRDRSQAEELLRSLGERRRKCGESARAIYERCGVPNGGTPGVERRCREFPTYRAARKTLDDRELALRYARERIDALEVTQPLLDAPIADLQRELDEAVAGAAELRQITDEIAKIRGRVEDAKKFHHIESCNEQVERCREALREVRERETRGVIAARLVSAVRSATETEHLPGVFRRAQELFSRITHGRYSLAFTSAPEPEFRAFDNEERRGLELDELSSGTRVQLLLAVRVAFVDTQEGEARLPLVLDEVLGNSDDERAAAIMDAVLELAREGRQIFYLTAQRDEVEKWRAVLAAEAEVEHRVIDLAEVRRLQRPLQTHHLRVAAHLPPGIPEPAGADHGEYATALGVPGFDPITDHAAGLHLWYLVDDPATLHDLLMGGAERWGALEGLVRHAGVAIADPEVLARTGALARAADAWLESRRVGAGRPVERDVLVRENGVTQVFLDRVDYLRRELGGDAKRLISALEGGAIKRFGPRNTEPLRAFLEGDGYLDQRDPLPDAEIRGRTIGSVAPEIESGILTVREVDALIARLEAGAARD